MSTTIDEKVECSRVQGLRLPDCPIDHEFEASLRKLTKQDSTKDFGAALRACNLDTAALPKLGKQVRDLKFAAEILTGLLSTAYAEMGDEGTDAAVELQDRFLGITSSMVMGANLTFGVVLAELNNIFANKDLKVSDACREYCQTRISDTARYIDRGLEIRHIKNPEEGEKLVIVDKDGGRIGKMPQRRSFKDILADRIEGKDVTDPKAFNAIDNKYMAAIVDTICFQLKRARDRTFVIETCLANPATEGTPKSMQDLVHQLFDEIAGGHDEDVHIHVNDLKIGRVNNTKSRVKWLNQTCQDLIRGLVQLKSLEDINRFESERMLKKSQIGPIKKFLFKYTKIREGKIAKRIKKFGFWNATIAVGLVGMAQMIPPVDAFISAIPVIKHLYYAAIFPLWKVASVALLVYTAEHIPKTLLDRWTKKTENNISEAN